MRNMELKEVAIVVLMRREIKEYIEIKRREAPIMDKILKVEIEQFVRIIPAK